tara:strand:- start:40 stop:1158 length:1119 start_codon:yes stop_codon:yes gene_type:complete
MIPIYKPYLPKSVLEYAHKAVDSTWISSQGDFLYEAEEKLKQLLGVSYVQLVNNGTAATHLVAKALTYKYPHIKTLFVPNNVYVAAWNAFKYDNNVELIPIDADEDTWNFDLEKLKEAVQELDEQCAVLVVHNLGNIVDVPALEAELPDGTIIVEDNCEGFMGTYGDHYAGTQSLVSSVSFFGNKTITSGEGGAVIIKDLETANYIKSVQGQGQAKGKRYIHDQLGYNYRMTNIQAALLVGQLEVLPTIKSKKEELFSYYREEFEKIEGVELQKSMPNTAHSNWMTGIRVLGSPSFVAASEYLKEKGVDSRPMFYPMSYHSHLKDVAQSELEVSATRLSKECIILPSYPDITKQERKQVVQSVKDYVKALSV